MAIFRIAEHDVQFPHETCYGVQIAFMEKLIHAVSASSHALLEAPTGTGKTLAILCAVLAWQTKFRDTVAAAAEAEELALEQLALPAMPDAYEPYMSTQEIKGICKDESSRASDDKEPSGPGAMCKKDPPADRGSAGGLRGAPATGTTCCKSEGGACQPQQGCAEQAKSEDKPAVGQDTQQQGHNQGKQTTLHRFEPVTKAAGVPRIFYATRTHSQIAQVVHELKRTTYRPSIAILAAKKHYCIHEQVLKGDVSVDEGCEKLMDATGCAHKKLVKEAVPYLQRDEDLKVHDIEDLVATCKKRHVCPYFVARELAEHADLVFCPYNYIIDPMIRNSVGIQLQNSVVVFDEAHNIEDVCREAASIDVPGSALSEALRDIQEPVENYATPGDASPEHYRQLYAILQGALGRVLRWLENIAQSTAMRKVDTDRYEGVWSGGQIRQKLEDAGLGPASLANLLATLQELLSHLKAVRQQKEETGTKNTSDKTARFALGLLDRLFLVLGILYRAVEAGPQSNDACDFRLVVTRWLQRGSGQRRAGKFRGRPGRDVEEAGWQSQLSLWCLNPACIFEEIGSQARTVVVTSGTLSPMSSMASELGVKFAEELEGPHVVPNERVLPLCISRSPQNHAIKAVFAESNKESFQDGVGDAITAIARAVPDGMLVFMPSYGYLDKLKTRWRETHLWDRLREIKPIWVEPRSAEELESSIGDFYEAVRSGKGALYFAVCCGKVSEGINFANANARAVVVLGIPFPNFKDSKVALKQKYNTSNVRRGLVPGSTWYKQQAFRAMNQALGRCIRHRNDWGSIILLDERLRFKDNQVCLSKWLRTRIYSAPQFDAAITRLTDFCTLRTAADAHEAGALHAVAGSDNSAGPSAAAPSTSAYAGSAANAAQSSEAAKARWNDAVQPRVHNTITSMFARPASGAAAAAAGYACACADATQPVAPVSGAAGHVFKVEASSAPMAQPSTVACLRLPKVEDSFIPALESVCGAPSDGTDSTQPVSHPSFLLSRTLPAATGLGLTHQAEVHRLRSEGVSRDQHDIATQRVGFPRSGPIALSQARGISRDGCQALLCTQPLRPVPGVASTQATQPYGYGTQRYASVPVPGQAHMAACPNTAAATGETSAAAADQQHLSYMEHGGGAFGSIAPDFVPCSSGKHQPGRGSTALSMVQSVAGPDARATQAASTPPTAAAAAAVAAASPSSIYCTPSAASLGFASGCDSEHAAGGEFVQSCAQHGPLPSLQEPPPAVHTQTHERCRSNSAEARPSAAAAETPAVDERGGSSTQLADTFGTPGFTSASQLLQERRRSSNGGGSGSVPAPSDSDASRRTPPPLAERLQDALAAAHGATEGGCDAAAERSAKRMRHEHTQPTCRDASQRSPAPSAQGTQPAGHLYVQVTGKRVKQETPMHTQAVNTCSRAPNAACMAQPSTNVHTPRAAAGQTFGAQDCAPASRPSQPSTGTRGVMDALPEGLQSYLDSGMFADDFCDSSDGDDAGNLAPASGLKSGQACSDDALHSRSGVQLNVSLRGAAPPAAMAAPSRMDSALLPVLGAAANQTEVSKLCRAWIDADIARFAVFLGSSPDFSKLSAADRNTELRRVLMDAVVQAGRAERSGALETWLRDFAVTPLGVLFAIRHANNGGSHMLRRTLRDMGFEASDGGVAVLGTVGVAGLATVAALSIGSALNLVIELYLDHLKPGTL